MLIGLKSRLPKLIHVIPCQDGSGVSAVTSLEDEVFVARYNSKWIEVYDAVTFTLQHLITVTGLGPWPFGIAACARNKCIYLSDHDKNTIHRIEPSDCKAAQKWSVESGPAGLSVNNAHNLVVACCKASKLQEYTTLGNLVSEISLQAGLTSPWHAIQLTTGDYVVCQFRLPGVVNVVGENGLVIKHSYEPSKTSDVGQMNGPSSLAATSNGDILVADLKNNRIQSINRSTGCVQELALSVEGGIREPLGICLDESRRRLYVGELEGQHRVLVFDIVAATLP